jgi:hypothetical protein
MTSSKIIAVWEALLSVTRAQATTFAAARALTMMPGGASPSSLLSRL